MPEGVRTGCLRHQEPSLLRLNEPSLLWLRKTTNKRLLWLLLLLTEGICSGLLRQDKARGLHLNLLWGKSERLCGTKLLLSKLLLTKLLLVELAELLLTKLLLTELLWLLLTKVQTSHLILKTTVHWLWWNRRTGHSSRHVVIE